MKFEEVLPKLREGKVAYIKSFPSKNKDQWVGKENYCLFYFESMDDFKKQYPNTKLLRLSELPDGPFLACYMHYETIDESYDNPKILHFDKLFYSDIIVQAEWDYFEKGKINV